MRGSEGIYSKREHFPCVCGGILGRHEGGNLQPELAIPDSQSESRQRELGLLDS